MQYFEMTVTLYLLSDIHFIAANEAIGKLISAAMFLDKELADKHARKEYKFYCFNSLYPTEKDKIYRRGRMYVFKLRSLEKEFMLKLRKLIKQTGCENIRVVSCDFKNKMARYISELRCVTPVIVTVDDRPWLREDDLVLLSERLQANLEKKYRDFYGEEVMPDQRFIQKIQVLNQKPFALDYKGISLLGNKFRIWVNDDESSQKLSLIALACGIGEKNSSLGAGFCEGR